MVHLDRTHIGLADWRGFSVVVEVDPPEEEFGAALLQFVAREGHAKVSKRHVELVDGDNHRLGGWVLNRRQDYKVGRLSQERIDALEAIPSWVWNLERGRR